MPLPTSLPAKTIFGGKKIQFIRPDLISTQPPKPKPVVQPPVSKPINKNPFAAAAETDSDDDNDNTSAPKSQPQQPSKSKPNVPNKPKHSSVAPQPPIKRKTPGVFEAAVETESDNDSDNNDNDENDENDDDDVFHHQERKKSPMTLNKEKFHPDNQIVQLERPKSNIPSVQIGIGLINKDKKDNKNGIKKNINNNNNSKDKSSIDDLFSWLKKTNDKNKKKNNGNKNNKKKDQKSDKKCDKNDKSDDNDYDFGQDDDNSLNRPPLNDDDDMGWLCDKNGDRKRTDEGFFIYTEDELRFGEGGDSPDCPFDCKCCYA